jgi:hypothetical protein
MTTTTNFRPNHKHENGNINFFTIMVAKVGVFLRKFAKLKNSQMFETDPARAPSPLPRNLL